MPYKVCFFCNQTSYSASERDIWLCPYCGKDMTFCEGFISQRPSGKNISERDTGLNSQLRLLHSPLKK